MKTIYEHNISDAMFLNYINKLTDRFFKILPLKEEGCTTLNIYMRKLQSELLGSKKLVLVLNDDECFLSLIAILQFLMDSDCSIEQTKEEVFEAIYLCEKIQSKYAGDFNE